MAWHGYVSSESSRMWSGLEVVSPVSAAPVKQLPKLREVDLFCVWAAPEDLTPLRLPLDRDASVLRFGPGLGMWVAGDVDVPAVNAALVRLGIFGLASRLLQPDDLTPLRALRVRPVASRKVFATPVAAARAWPAMLGHEPAADLAGAALVPQAGAQALTLVPRAGRGGAGRAACLALGFAGFGSPTPPGSSWVVEVEGDCVAAVPAVAGLLAEFDFPMVPVREGPRSRWARAIFAAPV